MIIPNRTLVVYVVEFQKRGPPHAHFAVFTAQHTGGPVMLKRYGTVIRPVPARAGWNLGTKGKCKGSRKRCPRCPMRVCNCSRLHMFARFTVHTFFASNLESIITDVWTHSGQGVFLVARHK